MVVDPHQPNCSAFGVPLVVGVGFLLMGIFLILIWASGNPSFFRSKPTTFEGDLEAKTA